MKNLNLYTNLKGLLKEVLILSENHQDKDNAYVPSHDKGLINITSFILFLLLCKNAVKVEKEASSETTVIETNSNYGLL